jgi:hypothetical protein
MDGAPVYDRAKLDSAVARFRESNLNPAEAMIASVELALESLGRFCTEAGAFRQKKVIRRTGGVVVRRILQLTD